jgi:hypothetical protein
LLLTKNIDISREIYNVPSIINTLTRRLSEICHSANSGEVAWVEWVDEPLGLSTWQAWTLLGLVKHRARQQFVADTIRFRLQSDEQALADAGAFGHPDIPQQGIVPSLIDWEYYFHGRGCCLTNRHTGESIDVDFYDETADWFDEFFYTTYLKSLKEPAFVEQRLIVLHPSIEAVRIEINDLIEQGFLERFEDRGIFRLRFSWEPMTDLLDQLTERWHDRSVQIAIAAAIGDWPLLIDLLGADVPAAVKERMGTLLKERNAKLIRHATSGGKYQSDALRALYAIRSPDLPRLLSKALAGEPSGTTSATLEIIARLDDPGWCRDLEKLLKRIDPNGSIPQPYIWHAAAKLLLRFGRAGQLRKTVPKINSNCLGDVALLSLEYFPDLAVNTFWRALRSDIPCNRITAAAALAIIDQPWSRAELLAAIRDSDDHVTTTECRSALMMTHWPEGQEAVLEWEARNPRAPQEGPFFTMDDMALRQSDETINWEMEKLHDRVIQLRGVLPGN